MENACRHFVIAEYLCLKTIHEILLCFAVKKLEKMGERKRRKIYRMYKA
jgi:hypothetical protein